MFFFSASEVFLGALPGGEGKFLAEMGGMEEEDKVGWIDMIFEQL